MIILPSPFDHSSGEQRAWAWRARASSRATMPSAMPAPPTSMPTSRMNRVCMYYLHELQVLPGPEPRRHRHRAGQSLAVGNAQPPGSALRAPHPCAAQYATGVGMDQRGARCAPWFRRPRDPSAARPGARGGRGRRPSASGCGAGA